MSTSPIRCSPRWPGGHADVDPQLQVATGYSPRFGQLVYTVLTRLAREGLVEKISAPDMRPVYWRSLAPAIILPPLDVISDQDRRRKP